MRFIHAEPDSPVINGLSRTVEEDRCTLRWQWPASIQAVYIGVSTAERVEENSDEHAGLKLYTRAEYKANNGYHTRMEGIGRNIYTVYACMEDGSEKLLVVQSGGENRIEVSAGKASIRYSIRQKTGLFQKFKTIHIQVTSEVPVDRDVLCYVKKQGGYPANKEDGIQYPFVSSFAAGRNALPPIEVGKQDFVRLFFTDGPKYGQMYELLPE